MARSPITRECIEHFLEELGRRYGAEGRLYLVGDTGMVFLGFRPRADALDYIADLSGDHREFVAIERALIGELDISIEPASPSDFIPLPRGWERRSRYVARCGHIEVFTFDPIATALVKIERGSNRDIDDALLLVRHRLLTLSELTVAFAEIYPQLEREARWADPDDFRRKFAAFLALVEQDTAAP